MSPRPPFNLLYLVSANIVKNQVDESGSLYRASKKDVSIRMLLDPQQAEIGTPRPLCIGNFNQTWTRNGLFGHFLLRQNHNIL